jgi:hypothetical protein
VAAAPYSAATKGTSQELAVPPRRFSASDRFDIPSLHLTNPQNGCGINEDLFDGFAYAIAGSITDQLLGMTVPSELPNQSVAVCKLNEITRRR